MTCKSMCIIKIIVVASVIIITYIVITFGVIVVRRHVLPYMYDPIMSMIMINFLYYFYFSLIN